jgi:hypothetical protein
MNMSSDREVGYLLMTGDDRFSQEIRDELTARGIRFAEIDVGPLPDAVVPTLVVRGGCAVGDVSYEGLGRIRREFLVRYAGRAGAATGDRPPADPATRPAPAH